LKTTWLEGIHISGRIGWIMVDEGLRRQLPPVTLSTIGLIQSHDDLLAGKLRRKIGVTGLKGEELRPRGDQLAFFK